jgi:hypothetical protein
MNHFEKRWMNKEWFVWGNGPRVMFFSACAMVVLGLLFWVTDSSEGALERAVAASKFLQYTVASIGAVGAAGTLLLYVSMWYFLIRVDRSSKWFKRASFLLLLVGLIYGGLIYYLLVYLRQVASIKRMGAAA